MADLPVKWFRSDMRGAPVKSGSGAGSIIAILQACLIDGFGQVTANAVVISGGLATFTMNANETFEKHAVVLIEGADDGDLNGEARVLSSDGN